MEVRGTSLIMKMAESKINWTGNPWVDTGLAVMVAKAKKENIEDFTYDDFENVISDGVWLAEVNRKLKAFNMVAGTNSSLTNTSLNDSLKKKNKNKSLNSMDDEGFKQYCDIIKKLKDSVLNCTGGKFICESCGERPTTEVLLEYGKDIGRDWFPLIGSIGNDAQALPAASRTARICSLCLLSIQFLPLGAFIVGGKIACFQSTYMELTQLMVSEIYKKTTDKLQLLRTDERLPAVGQGEGSKTAIIKLLRLMEIFQQNKRMVKLPRYISLNIWLFSNSGQGPDSDLIEIPNNALTFLWDCARLYRNEIEELLKKETKKVDFQLFECIKRKIEYSGFYPYKDSKPASKGLFELYHKNILGDLQYSLELAEWIAYNIKSKLSAGDKNDKKLLAKLIKENAYKSKGKELLKKIKGIFIRLAEEGSLSLEDYSLLFPKENDIKHFSVKKEAFKWIWFYLNQDNINDKKPAKEAITCMDNHYQIVKTFAKDTFDYYKQKERREIKYIKNNILDKFKKGDISTHDMKRWFINLAEDKKGYTNDAWDDLCRDDNGNNNTSEVRFVFRLEMTNLYRQAKITEGGTAK